MKATITTGLVYGAFLALVVLAGWWFVASDSKPSQPEKLFPMEVKGAYR